MIFVANFLMFYKERPEKKTSKSHRILKKIGRGSSMGEKDMKVKWPPEYEFSSIIYSSRPSSTAAATALAKTLAFKGAFGQVMMLPE